MFIFIPILLLIVIIMILKAISIKDNAGAALLVLLASILVYVFFSNLDTKNTKPLTPEQIEVIENQ